MNNTNELYYPNDANTLTIETQFTLKKVSASVYKMSNKELVKYVLDIMVLLLRLKTDSNKIMDLMKKQKELSQESIRQHKQIISDLKIQLNNK